MPKNKKIKKYLSQNILTFTIKKSIIKISYSVNFIRGPIEPGLFLNFHMRNLHTFLLHINQKVRDFFDFFPTTKIFFISKNFLLKNFMVFLRGKGLSILRMVVMGLY